MEEDIEKGYAGIKVIPPKEGHNVPLPKVLDDEMRDIHALEDRIAEQKIRIDENQHIIDEQRRQISMHQEVLKEKDQKIQEQRRKKTVWKSITLTAGIVYGLGVITLRNHFDTDATYEKTLKGDIDSVIKRYNRLEDAGSFLRTWAWNPEIAHEKVLEALEYRIGLMNEKYRSRETVDRKEFHAIQHLISNFSDYTKNQAISPKVNVYVNKLKAKVEEAEKVFLGTGRKTSMAPQDVLERMLGRQRKEELEYKIERLQVELYRMSA